MKSLTTSVCLAATLASTPATAITTTFFSPDQVATMVDTGVTSDSIESQGYLFTYTMDKLFTGGVGMTDPIGRYIKVPWPTGLEAQAITTPPPGEPYGDAQITISRVDGEVFDLTAFTAKLLGNTAATGAAIEVMPILDGEDALDDPVFFDASGYYGSDFSYSANLTGYESYKLSLFVDFALIGLTLVDASPAPVPEAETWMLMLAGLGMVGWAGRHRR